MANKREHTSSYLSKYALPWHILYFLHNYTSPKNVINASLSAKCRFGEKNILNAIVDVTGKIILYHAIYLLEPPLLNLLFIISSRKSFSYSNSY